MISKIRNLFLSVILVLTSSSLLASHVAGGNISYQCTGVPGVFIITLTIYRDCGGVNMQDPESIKITNDCGSNDTTILIPEIAVQEVSQICKGSLTSTECGSGSLPGIEKYTYQTTFKFDILCDAWTMSYTRCARNDLENIKTSSSCFYIETKLYSATQACNTSPTINSQPIPYACKGQAADYDFSVLELDGDSLTYELVSALTSGGVELEYATGYSDSLPLPGISVNPTTGQINFTPTKLKNFVVVLLIKEYNQCGDLVGSLMHDIQFVIEDCTNNVPKLVTAPTKIKNFNNNGTNAQLIGDNQIKLCTGDEFCFDVSFNDADLGDVVQLSTNAINFLPGATFTTVNGNPAIATICWKYQQGYTGSVISINATDDKCDVPGFANFAVDLDVPPAVFPGKDSAFNLCGNEGTINLFDYLGGFFQIDGQWKFNGQPISNFQAVNNMQAGTYWYVVKPDTVGAALCGVQANVCVEADSAKLVIGLAELVVFSDKSTIKNESCSEIFDGAWSIGPVTGNFGPFDVVWNSPYKGPHASETINVGGISSQTNLYNDSTGAFPWIVTVTDTNGCSWSKSFQIYEGALDISPTIGQPNCYGFETGSIALNSAGTGGNVTYYLTNIQGDTLTEDGAGVYNLLGSGTYIVIATDTFGCVTNNKIEIVEPFAGPISATYSIADPDCHQTAEGAILITSVYNTDYGMDNIQFNWAPAGEPGNGLGKNILINALPGEYTVVLVDSIGCSNELTFVINDKNPLTAKLDVAEKTYCRTAGWQSGNGVVTVTNVPDSSGTGNLNFQWRHLVSGAESHATTFVVRDPGNIEMTVTDGYECVYVDTIYVDSINPVANFSIESDKFLEPGVYDGEEDLKIKIKNLSTGYEQIGNPNSQAIFQWNLNNTNINDQDYWFFTYAIDDRPDTTYQGVEEHDGTVYEVCLIAINFNECSDTLCQDVIVQRIPDLTLPNVFTPGSVPNNEFFFPAVGYPVFSAKVINRYGVLVYEFNDIYDKWDGNHYKTGKPCVDGVYNYIYQAETSKGTAVDGSGQIHLIRHKP